MDYPRALEIAAETMSSLAYKDAVLQIHDDILNGATLTSAVVKTGMFPELLTSLMSIGEETGNIPKMLSNAADYFEDEVQTATLQLTSALNPVIIIFMGVFIGLLVYSIYSPMFSMYSGIS
jgi:type IV pilus assembly protein PilC